MDRKYYNSELAELADVSYSTFFRYLQSRREILSGFGCATKAQTLRGQALDYVCRDYNIHLPEEPTEPPRKHIKIR